MLASDAWMKLCERYEGKGKQSIAYLIGELFRGTLSDESPMEPKLNAMRQKAQVLNSDRPLMTPSGHHYSHITPYFLLDSPNVHERKDHNRRHD
ncbi:hypothetical protein DFJ58DRAFT_777133 [Suillus subalutaceus]|uniref:uncharacterized protein n=1 Tax=Suillus subalutaceus TaxID=48586 RepID=UPI001B85FC44|nr:uncharacterized protein DFJ58DRAFT_777133 [Suillus subalutaceus]KAG1861803.1 hypothetical protein DFJ58DRAFT_777133 [Suillus subalutaceus]